jgi:hypothetical protein
MRAMVIACAVVAAVGASECRALDWEVNLESHLNSSPPLSKLDDAGYRWDLSGFGDSSDLFRAEATFRPSSVGPIDWEIGVGASVRPGSRTDGYDQRGRRALGDFDGSLVLRATIRSGTARSTR